MKVEIELPKIEGFEYTGEYRKAKKREWFLGINNGTATTSSKNTGFTVHILKKVKQWREITPLEALKELYEANGELDCQLYDDDMGWVDTIVTGIDTAAEYPFLMHYTTTAFKRCRIEVKK